jgi:hypothetical protein
MRLCSMAGESRGSGGGSIHLHWRRVQMLLSKPSANPISLGHRQVSEISRTAKLRLGFTGSN